MNFVWFVVGSLLGYFAGTWVSRNPEKLQAFKEWVKNFPDSDGDDK